MHLVEEYNIDTILVKWTEKTGDWFKCTKSPNRS